MTETELDNMTGEEIFQEFIDQERIYRFEGSSGMENLNKVAHACGYRKDQFGSEFDNFLSDNPGVMEAIVNWVNDNADSFVDSIRNEVFVTDEPAEGEENGEEGDE